MLTIGRCPIRHGTNGDQLNVPVVIALGSDDVFLKALHVHGGSGAPLVVADVVNRSTAPAGAFRHGKCQRRRSNRIG